MNGFEGLAVWKECRNFRKEISKLTKTFPLEEKYRIVDQLLRSSRSVTANLAEGYGRYHYLSNINFCYQARGSLYEALEHLICAYDESYIDQIQLDVLRKKFNHCLKLLNGYILYLKNRKKED